MYIFTPYIYIPAFWFLRASSGTMWLDLLQVAMLWIVKDASRQALQNLKEA